jgi:two-component system, LytTR family, sensor kinase
MRRENLATQSWLQWGLIFLCWAIVGLFYIGRNLGVYVTGGQPLAWHRAILFELIYWYIWALLTPLIFWCARRFPAAGGQEFRRSQRIRGVLAVTLIGLCIAVIQTALDFAINITLAWKVIRIPDEELRRVISGIKRGVIVESFGGFITFAIILGAYYAFEYYQKYRQREIRALQLEGQLAQAEMQNLKMQLHPHFLFNTLNAISVLMLEDVQAANRMLVRLSDLLRITLENSGTQEVSLKEEVEFL